MQSERAAHVFGDSEDPRVRLHALFGGEMPRSGQPPTAALEWARGVVAGLPTDRRDAVSVTRALRAQQPRLTLKSAGFLADHALAGS